MFNQYAKDIKWFRVFIDHPEVVRARPRFPSSFVVDEYAVVVIAPTPPAVGLDAKPRSHVAHDTWRSTA